MAVHPEGYSVLTAPHGVCWVLIEAGMVLLEQCPKKASVLGYPAAWFVPGGKIHRLETASEALYREVAEEWPGVEILTARPLPLLEGSSVPPGPVGLFLMRPFAIRVRGSVPGVSGDGVPLRWFPIAEALEYSPVPQVRMMIAAANGPGWA